MNRASYGKTWWGEQWLHALSHIDFDNRLPRGRSYANKGAVRDLAVTGGRVEARVQGSRPRPYAVTVSVPPLAAKDSARLLDRLAAEIPAAYPYSDVHGMREHEFKQGLLPSVTPS
jgi:uncharacterized Zn finger protein